MSLRESAFVQEATTGKRVTRWWVAILVFAGFFVGNIALIGVMGAVLGAKDGTPGAQLQEGLADLLTILVVFAFVVLVEGRRVASLGFHRPGRGAMTLVAGVGIGLVMISVPILILWATGVYTRGPTPAGGSTGFAALPLIVLVVLTVIAQGSSEEILTRGFLFQNLGLHLPAWLAVVIPTFIFTVVHGVIASPVVFVTIFMYGIFAILVVIRRGSLWLICGIHAGWNWAIGNIFGVSVSGLEPKATALVYLKAANGQPSWLTGASGA